MTICKFCTAVYHESIYHPGTCGNCGGPGEPKVEAYLGDGCFDDETDRRPAPVYYMGEECILQGEVMDHAAQVRDAVDRRDAMGLARLMRQRQ